MIRRVCFSLVSLFFVHQAQAAIVTAEDFEACKAQWQTSAAERHFSDVTINQIIPSLLLQKRVLELDKSQPEFVQTFPGYFTKRVTNWRVSKGQAMYKKHKTLLKKLNDKYGIPPHYLLAFWGLETNFGSYKGKMPVLDSLATLACDKRRSDYFTQELMVALHLMERENLSQDIMVGSWAGAMGHTQFMPSAYLNYAVDGDDDGQVNLWESEEDALTSAANFLAQLGWKPGYRWGREVKLAANFNYESAGIQAKRSMVQWAELGVYQADGSTLPTADIQAYLVVPAGSDGPAFLAYTNFNVIMRWNNSEFYAIAVGHLADRIAGAKPLIQALPDLPAYSRLQIKQLQQRLNERGYDVGRPDGIIGPATRKGIRAFQSAESLVADGFPSLNVMEKLGVDLPAPSDENTTT